MKYISIILTMMAFLFSTTAEAKHHSHHYKHRITVHHQNKIQEYSSNTPEIITRMIGKSQITEIVQTTTVEEIPTQHVLPATTSDWSGSSNPATVALEYIGSTANRARETLIRLFKKAPQPEADPTKLPWCAAFVNGVLAQSGKTGSGSLLAASFKSWGRPTSNPKPGDVVVIGSHHVGFYLGKENGMIKIVSGNHHHAVGVGLYSPRTVSAYRE